MEKLITSLNYAMDIEKMNYKKFSQTGAFMMAGLKYLHKRYRRNVRFVFNYLSYSFNNDLYNDLQASVDVFFFIPERYMVIPLSIQGPEVGHANVLFFFKEKDKVYCERYDPQYSCCIGETYHKKIDADLSRELSKLNVIYVSPEKMGVIVCPQAYIRDDFGYCQTYTIIYLDKLLSNPSENRLRTIADFPTENDLKRYIKHIVEMIIKLPGFNNYDKNILLNYDIQPEVMRDYISLLVFLIISSTFEVTSSSV